MSNLSALGSDLVALYFVLMVCCWLCSEISMNWFLRTDFMDQKTSFLSDKSRFFIELPEIFSPKTWNNHRYTHCFGWKKLRESWWKKLLILWVVGWLLGSAWIFWFMCSQAVEKRRELLANMCDERARMLQDQFNVSMNHIQALAILVSTFHHSKDPSAIDQRTFARYTERTAFERPLTSGVAYAVKVLHSERERFEKQQGWSIKRMDAEDQLPAREDGLAPETLETSPAQEEYAPVIFAQDTVSHVISFDMLSGKEDHENILRSRESGKGVLTAPFRLLKSNRLGVILTFAVYSTELPSNATPADRIRAAIGYIGGIFDIESLVDKLLHQLACKQSIIVNVYDTTDPVKPISMYGTNLTGDDMYHKSILHFGDPLRKHEMHCSFTHKPPFPWLEITTSIGTLVIALLIGHIFHATVNRIAKVEDDYRKMMELKKQAEDADVAKSQFLATVSHEIRTPMNGVLGMLQMLMDTELDITQQDYVRTAQASGKALVSLINEVLDQAKIESGNHELEYVRFDLRVLLDDVLSLFYGKSQEKGIELAVYVSDKVPEVLIGDPGRIRQIITNLIGNSVKFTEKGHIFVSVDLVEEVMCLTEAEADFQSMNTLSGLPVADRRHSLENFKIFSQDTPVFPHAFLSTSSDLINLIVSVEDTGTGIPQGAQSRVFTPYMQVGSSTSRVHGGTGIGLSISKCLVGLMKGEIGFVSEPNVGSTFTFTAVLTRGHANSSEYKSREFHGMRAWVVDHRPSRAKVARYHLRRLGIHVELVTDLYQAFLRLMNNGKSIVNMMLIDKEAWPRDADLWPLLINVLQKGNQSSMPKLFLLDNPTSFSKSKSSNSLESILTVITKPLRASMLAVHLRRAMGLGEKESFGNGDIPRSSLCNLLDGKHILVVDDNKVNLRVAAGALKKYGAEVTCADSGKEAIKKLEPPHKFDACFMDIQMPETDGFEATRIIRKMESDANDRINHGEVDHGNALRWHVPILAMTADVIQATQEECRKCGMDGYVSKPFEGEQLYREVTRFFN
ncbi:histidine kinase 2/3/4 (cytokinin receptor) protein [Dioscorea alata]|uniref:Histidine kinase 2/3/4 (Cytokinin receptor) protein n=1 Tax=Dioscorea alata TaxID=55571 RepID=A0ACB7W6Y5_DIOAL|nr:histidine kinase 2/3/4 (cytokinin receptor) protein [Dioscorea alata]